MYTVAACIGRDFDTIALRMNKLWLASFRRWIALTWLLFLLECNLYNERSVAASGILRTHPSGDMNDLLPAASAILSH